jgi:hypothetical protein
MPWKYFTGDYIANGYWLVRAPTGDPVGPRVDVAAVVGGEPSAGAQQKSDHAVPPSGAQQVTANVSSY